MSDVVLMVPNSELKKDSRGEVVRQAVEQSPGAYDYLNKWAKRLGIDIEEIVDIDIPTGPSEVEGPSEVDCSGYRPVDDCYKKTIY